MNKPLFTFRQCWQRFILSLHVNGHMGERVFNWLTVYYGRLWPHV